MIYCNSYLSQAIMNLIRWLKTGSTAKLLRSCHIYMVVCRCSLATNQHLPPLPVHRQMAGISLILVACSTWGILEGMKILLYLGGCACRRGSEVYWYDWGSLSIESKLYQHLPWRVCSKKGVVCNGDDVVFVMQCQGHREGQTVHQISHSHVIVSFETFWAKIYVHISYYTNTVLDIVLFITVSGKNGAPVKMVQVEWKQMAK